MQWSWQSSDQVNKEGPMPENSIWNCTESNPATVKRTFNLGIDAVINSFNHLRKRRKGPMPKMYKFEQRQHLTKNVLIVLRTFRIMSCIDCFVKMSGHNWWMVGGCVNVPLDCYCSLRPPARARLHLSICLVVYVFVVLPLPASITSPPLPPYLSPKLIFSSITLPFKWMNLLIIDSSIPQQ